MKSHFSTPGNPLSQISTGVDIGRPEHVRLPSHCFFFRVHTASIGSLIDGITSFYTGESPILFRKKHRPLTVGFLQSRPPKKLTFSLSYLFM
jgi:hypothetical protein